MSINNTRRRFLGVTGGAVAVSLAGCLGGSDDGDDDPGANDGDTGGDDPGSADDETSPETTFTVRIENVAPTDFYATDSATGGQIWLTPGAFAVHSNDNPIFTVGEMASIGLEAVAEAGPPTGFEGEPGLVDELAEADLTEAGAYTPASTVADPNDPMGNVPGAPPIAPGGAFEFEIEATPGDRLSMYVPSNDIFLSSAAGIALFENGDPITADVTDAVGLFDAGTELNGRPGSDPVGAPRQTNNGGAIGGAVEGVVYPANQVNDAFMYADTEGIIQLRLDPQ